MALEEDTFNHNDNTAGIESYLHRAILLVDNPRAAYFVLGQLKVVQGNVQGALTYFKVRAVEEAKGPTKLSSVV